MDEIGLVAIVVVSMLVGGFLFAQKAHYEHLKTKEECKNTSLLTADLEKKLKEFEEYKKRMDALTLKAGFKL